MRPLFGVGGYAQKQFEHQNCRNRSNIIVTILFQKLISNF